MEKDTHITIKRLSSDNDYYNNVFKKTEKTVSVLLYIISETEQNDRNESYILNVKNKSLETHESALRTLRLQHANAIAGLRTFQYSLLELQSTLAVCETIGLIAPDLVALVTEQLDAVHRYISNHYMSKQGVSLESLADTAAPTSNQKTKAQPKSNTTTTSASRQRRVNIPAGDISSDAYLVYSQLTDRADRIKTVLEAKPQATVKDIAEVITDVSEKTIQRELNSLIEKGQVIREGERRWSRYSVSK